MLLQQFWPEMLTNELFCRTYFGGTIESSSAQNARAGIAERDDGILFRCSSFTPGAINMSPWM
jgi:hypothetical protein